MGDVKRYDPTFLVGQNNEILVFMEIEKAGGFVDHSDYADLHARHTALVEAVKKYFKSECLEILKREARAEVDRLIGEGEK